MQPSTTDFQQIYSFLIAAGLVPFFIAAKAPIFSLEVIPVIGDIRRAGALYALVIVSFMAGVHWGICIANNSLIDSSKSAKLMIASNAYAVFQWLCYLFFGPYRVFNASLIIAFSLIFISDRSLFKQSVINEYYYRTRKLVTIAVLVCLSLSFVTRLN
jgi:hypothetical protein